jgi:hypothetical protein
MKNNDMGGASGKYGEEVHAGFRWGNLKEGDHLEDPCVDGMIILKLSSSCGMGAWTGLIWFRIWTGGVLL